jgi:hypothetical protein
VFSGSYQYHTVEITQLLAWTVLLVMIEKVVKAISDGQGHTFSGPIVSHPFFLLVVILTKARGVIFDFEYLTGKEKK